jgi:hypothetical protein
VISSTVRFALLAAATVFVISLIGGGQDREVAVRTYVIAVGAVSLLQVLRTTAGHLGVERTSAPSLVARGKQGPRKPPVPLAAITLEGLIVDGAQSARATALRLRPRLIDLTQARLYQRTGIDLVHQPEEAAAALGPEAWDIVRPDRIWSEDRLAPGLPPESVNLLVTRLEQL